jgi:Flp pilus assembly protein TadD
LPIIPLTIIDFGGPPSDIVADTGGQLRVGTGVSRLDYLFTQFRVIVTYLRLLFLPVSQNLDYDYPIYTSFFSLPVLLSFLLLVFIFAAAVYLFWRTRWVRINQIEIQVENRTDLVEGQGDTGSSQSAFQSQSLIRLVAFGIFWFFLTLSVESTFIPIVDVIMEHRLYLPNFGAAAGFAVAFHLMARKFPRLAGGKLFFVGATILVLVLGFATYQRNHIWGDSLRLWQDVVTKSPNKGRALNNLGVALDDAGKRQDAYNLFTQAIAVDPNYYKSYYNLADLYLVSGQPDEALPLLQTAIRINPNFREAYVSIGAALMRAGKYREVTTFLEKNLKYVYENAEAYFYIGASYAFIGNRQEAMKLLSIISQIDPSYAASLAGLLGVKSNPSSATRSH